MQRRWSILLVLLLGITIIVFGLAKWRPFAPTAAPAADAATGDATAGAATFANACAGCHGAEGRGGGVGPTLAGTGPREAQTVAGIIASGRGTMPPGVVAGADAANVAAYVAQIGGGAVTAPRSDPPGSESTAVLVGRDLSGIEVRLATPAPADWTVWIDGRGGRRSVGTIAAGASQMRADRAVGGASIAATHDTVLVGADPDAPALRGALAADRTRALRTLLVDDPDRAGTASVFELAQGQVDVLHEHVGFLARAERESNLANVRFHGEHMVNITRGAPARDVDGNGDPSNPGDGVGLTGGAASYFPRISRLAGSIDEPTQAASLAAGRIADDGAIAGRATSVRAASPAIARIRAADASFAQAWNQMRLQMSETIRLEAKP